VRPAVPQEFHLPGHTSQVKQDFSSNSIMPPSFSGSVSTNTNGMPADNAIQFQTAVVQEVAYYISQDVHSAEMKLEGLGGDSVEVSINLQGKEAQVVFRSDELHTREMLGNASAHLKDMLQQQGVVLTGVYVGTSGSGDSQQQAQKRWSRSATPVAMVMPIAAVDLHGPSVAASNCGRTLDLYV